MILLDGDNNNYELYYYQYEEELLEDKPLMLLSFQYPIDNETISDEHDCQISLKNRLISKVIKSIYYFCWYLIKKIKILMAV